MDAFADALVIGMDYDTYFNKEPELFNIYLKAYNTKEMLKENDMYIMYNYMLSTVASVFSKDAIIENPIHKNNEEKNKEIATDDEIKEYYLKQMMSM